MKKVIKIICIVLGIIIMLGIIFFSIDNYRVSKGQTPIFCIKNPAGVIADGGTAEYFGLGYKVIDFNTLAGYDEIKIGTWFMKYEDFSSEMAEYELKFESETTANENSEYNYSKTVNDVIVKLNIPEGWNYEETTDTQNENEKFTLTFYKTSKDKSASLNFYTNKFAVCGTGLEQKEITLNNGKTAEVGYYDGNENWDFISFYKSNNPYLAFINNGLDDDESQEVLELAKTINFDSGDEEPTRKLILW